VFELCLFGNKAHSVGFDAHLAPYLKTSGDQVDPRIGIAEVTHDHAAMNLGGDRKEREVFGLDQARPGSEASNARRARVESDSNPVAGSPSTITSNGPKSLISRQAIRIPRGAAFSRIRSPDGVGALVRHANSTRCTHSQRLNMEASPTGGISMVRPGADRHRAFLLRVWTSEQSDAILSSIRDVETGETHLFASLDQLDEWLRVEMNGPATPMATPSADAAPR
jgi:hypothetical protein